MEKISNFLFERITIPDLELSLDAYSKRQKAISNNIANADTPGYKAKRVSFEDQYKKFLKLDRYNLDATLTHRKHIEIGTNNFYEIKPRLELRKNRINNTGFNNVDIDFEMAELAKNNMRYEMSTNLISKRFKHLRSSIKGK